jgi:hypothetical protein
MERDQRTRHARPSSKAPLSSVRVPPGLEETPNAKPLAGASAGLVAGAALGAFAGPIGAVAGGIAGVVVGAAAGVALDAQEVTAADAEKQLDEEIGVIGGSIGAAPPNAPRATRGAFSAESSGLGGGTVESAPAEGPMPKGE